MASICNDEGVRFGGMSGHGGFVHTFSGAAHQQHRHRRLAQHLLGIAAQQHPAHAAPAMGAQHDELRAPFLGFRDDRIAHTPGVAFVQLGLHRNPGRTHPVLGVLQHVLGLFAVTNEKHTRQMPGRLCGETVDAAGKRGFVLTLSTREQHIRREKATSNICTNSGLCALAFSVHMTLLGEEGLRRLAAENHRLACLAADRLAKVPGVTVLNESFFNEFTVRLGQDARAVVRRLADDGVLAGVSLGRLYPGEVGLADGLVVAVTEPTREEDIEALAAALEGALA